MIKAVKTNKITLPDEPSNASGDDQTVKPIGLLNDEFHAPEKPEVVPENNLHPGRTYESSDKLTIKPAQSPQVVRLTNQVRCNSF